MSAAAGAALLICAGWPLQAHAQIGGQTGAGGDFILEDTEDLDLQADGVGRDWISDFNNGTSALKAIAPAGLTLVAGQSQAGVLEFEMKPQFSYIDMSFGVPMPQLVGHTTNGQPSSPPATYPAGPPGDITTFERLTFLATYGPPVAGAEFQVIVECYAEDTSPYASPYPRMIYNFVPAEGTQFSMVEVDLRQPDLILDQRGRTVDQLLGKTRFLSWYAFAGPVPPTTSTKLYVDDIKLEPEPSRVETWMLY